MKKYIFIVIILGCIFLGTFLRFYQLGKTPNSLDWDEVSWGYNAYSILKTGRDEYGVFLPTSFKAFSDYKQPVYVYLDVLPIKTFGLTAFAVRFPSAFFGSLSIFFVYVLVYELFKKESYGKKIALLSTIFYTISPWSIQFSRVAFEANIGLFFVIVGTWLFLKWCNTKKIQYVLLGILSLSISCYSYHSEKIFTPLFFLFLLGYSYISYKTKKKQLVILLVFFIFCNVFWISDTRTTARGRSVTFLSNQTQILQTSSNQAIVDQTRNDKLWFPLHNRRLVFLNKYAENYLLHFDPNFLFVLGDNPRHHAPGMGDLYLVSLPFILLGILFFLKERSNKSILILVWFVIGPLAASLAIDAPNASRDMIILPTWDILTASGILYFLSYCKGKLLLPSLLILLLFLFNFSFYIHQYFVHTNSDYEKYWQYGYSQAIQETSHSENNIFFAKDMEQAYIFYLFHTSYDPKTYINSGSSYRMQNPCFSIENAFFGQCDQIIRKGDIIVSTKPSIPGGKPYKTIFYTNGESAVTLYMKE